ncbi:MAG: hypothetical protein KDK03_08310 [Rhodobacteraceae bacterium]|uniref:DUF4870 family protein n=1 Tax=Amaricoccus sp. B4 TaxID=3368557 RepID=UPI000DAE841F|nr:hypothetical protein [Paracoccaceae bacterium]
MSELERLPQGDPGIMDPGKSNLQAIYVLYLLGFIFAITTVIGVVMAYVNRGKAAPWLDSHYTWAIRTFWIALLYALISALLSLVVIGVLGFIATAVWMIVRCVIGLQKIGRGEPIANPQSWLI